MSSCPLSSGSSALIPLLAFENIEVVTRSHPDAFPSALRDARKIQTTQHESSVVQTEVSPDRSRLGHPGRLCCFRKMSHVPSVAIRKHWRKRCRYAGSSGARVINAIDRRFLDSLSGRRRHGLLHRKRPRSAILLSVLTPILQCLGCSHGWVVYN